MELGGCGDYFARPVCVPTCALQRNITCMRQYIELRCDAGSVSISRGLPCQRKPAWSAWAEIAASTCMRGNMTRQGEFNASKVPEVTLVFWIIKIAATTLGETGGDTVTMTLGWSYLAGTAIFFALLVVLIVAQIAADKFHPFLYWATIVASTTAGTTLADFADRSLGIGYTGGSSLLFVCLIVVLGLWYWSLGSISVSTVSTPKAEAYYWAAITLSQTLGTALGDWTADDTGLGYLGGALVFAAGLAALALAYYLTNVSRVFLFWAASSCRAPSVPPSAIS